jgi:hypothetical protein
LHLKQKHVFHFVDEIFIESSAFSNIKP